MASMAGQNISYLGYNTPLLIGQSYETIYTITSQYESLSFMFKADQETTVNAYWKNDPADPDVVLAFTSTYDPATDPGGIILNTSVKGVYFSYTLENTSGVDQTILFSSCYGSYSQVPSPPPPPPLIQYPPTSWALNPVPTEMPHTYEPWDIFTEVPFVPGGLTALSNVTWQNQTGETISVLCTVYIVNATIQLSSGSPIAVAIRGYFTVNGAPASPEYIYSETTPYESVILSVPNNGLVQFIARLGTNTTYVVTLGVGTNITFLRLLT